MSAITLVGTTGHGYNSGMKFVQVYFALPLAMIILSVTVVPFFHRARVFTAYEFLEQRFDAKTRALTSFLFLISRGLSCGVIVAAPAVILSIVLGWHMTVTVLAIGVPTIDGMGPRGANFHTDAEYIEVDSLALKVDALVRFLVGWHQQPHITP